MIRIPASSLQKTRTKRDGYVHAKWETQRRFLRFLLREIVFRFLIRIDSIEGLENIPPKGAAIIMMNHIAFVDPIVMVYVVPRNIVPLAKIEVYQYPIIGMFPRFWGVIPVRRQEIDRQAIKRVMEVLSAGEIVLMAPEGTRNPQLAQAKEGVAYFASRSYVPVIPTTILGTPGFPALPSSTRWRQPGVSVKFHPPFRYKPNFERAGRTMLKKMTDEAMYILASKLPEHLRGFYSDISKASQESIEWL